MIVLGIILIFSTVIGIVVNQEITEGVKEFAVEKAKGDLSLAYRYVDNKYPGDWEVRDNQLYKGTTMMNDNFEIVDEIGNDTGDTVTIFQGDTRIATNVMLDGERAVGTQASPEVIEAVMKNKENYYGEADVAGNHYQTAYMPLVSEAGEVIGIFYVGASEKIISSILNSFLVKFLTVLAIMVGLSILAVYVFTRRLRKRLSVITNALELAGAGDFTSALRDQAGDELSTLVTSFNKMTTNLKAMMQQVISTSELVASSAEQLTASAEQSSRATEQVASAMQEIASGADGTTTKLDSNSTALQEILQGVLHISESSSKVSELSRLSTKQAEEGGKFVEDNLTQMKFIQESIGRSNQVVSLLSERSKEIGGILDVISGIADQTNLLALNAAIEAARAGEHGKGFAVVADEVRKLAEQSQTSTKSIAELISLIQRDTEESVKNMDEVVTNAEQGVRVSELTSEKFAEILSSTRDITPQIEQVSATVQQISASIDEVTDSAVEMAHLAQTNAASSEEVAASTEEQLASMEEIDSSAQALAEMAEQLKEGVNRFKL